MTPNIINLTMLLHRINKLKKQNNISLLMESLSEIRNNTELNSNNIKITIKLIDALGQIGDSDTIDLMLNSLTDKNFNKHREIREAVFEALRKLEYQEVEVLNKLCLAMEKDNYTLSRELPEMMNQFKKMNDKDKDIFLNVLISNLTSYYTSPKSDDLPRYIYWFLGETKYHNAVGYLVNTLNKIHKKTEYDSKETCEVIIECMNALGKIAKKDESIFQCFSQFFNKPYPSDVKFAIIDNLPKVDSSENYIRSCNYAIQLIDRDEEIQTATRCLTRVNGKVAINSLIMSLKRNKKKNKESYYGCNNGIPYIIMALGELKAFKAIDEVIELLSFNCNDHDYICKVIADFLIEIGEKSIEPLVIFLINGAIWLLENKNKEVMRVFSSNKEASIPVFISLLNDQNIKIRKYAANRLDEFSWVPSEGIGSVYYWIFKEEFKKCITQGNISVEPLIAAIDQLNLLDHWKSRQLEDVLFALGEIGDIRAFHALKYNKMKSNFSARIERKIGECLGKIVLKNDSDKIVLLDELIVLLEIDDAYTRINAAYALGEIKDNKCTAMLIKLLKSDKDSRVREVVAEVLGEFTDRKVISALANAFNDKIYDVRRNCVKSLNKIDSLEAVELLLKWMHYEPGYAIHAVEVFVSIGAACILKYFSETHLYSNKNLIEKTEIKELELKMLDSINDTIPKLYNLYSSSNIKVKTAAYFSLKEICNHLDKPGLNLSSESKSILKKVQKNLRKKSICSDEQFYYFDYYFVCKPILDKEVNALITKLYMSIVQLSWESYELDFEKDVYLILGTKNRDEVVEILIYFLYVYKATNDYRYEYAVKVLRDILDEKSIIALIDYINYYRFKLSYNKTKNINIVVKALAKSKSQVVLQYFLDLINVNYLERFDRNDSGYWCTLIFGHIPDLIENNKDLLIDGRQISTVASIAIIDAAQTHFKQENFDLLRTAIYALGEIADPIAIDFIYKYIGYTYKEEKYDHYSDLLTEEFNDSIKIAVFYTLGKMFDPRVIEWLCGNYEIFRSEYDNNNDLYEFIKLTVLSDFDKIFVFNALIDCIEKYKENNSKLNILNNAIYFTAVLLYECDDFFPDKQVVEKAFNSFTLLKQKNVFNDFILTKNGLPFVDGILLSLKSYYKNSTFESDGSSQIMEEEEE